MPRAVSRKGFLRLGGVGLAGAALVGAAGCGWSLGGNREVVRFLTGTEETAAQERAVTEIQVDGFEEQHPKYTLELEAIRFDEIRKIIQSRLRSDESPDVFSYDTGPGFGGVLADSGLLLPLEKAYQQRGWGIYEWAKQRATYNGTVYGVPDQVEEIIVYYNKDLVPEVPRTVGELRGVAEELKLRGTIPLAFGNREQYPAGHMFSIAASDLFFRDFVESGYYPQNVNAVTYDEASALFYTGEAAMLPTGTWQVSEIVQTVQDFEVGIFPFPSIDGSGISPPAGVGTGTFIAKGAKNPEGGIALIEYFQQDDTTRIVMETFNTIPARPVDTKGLNVPPLFKQVLDDLSKSTEAGAFGYNLDVLTPQNFNDVMFSGFQEVLNGTKSPAEQAAALQDAWETAKKQGKIAT